MIYAEYAVLFQSRSVRSKVLEILRRVWGEGSFNIYSKRMET